MIEVLPPGNIVAQIPNEVRDRRTLERRQKMYSQAALARTTKIDLALVMHRQFQTGLEAIDRVFQLGPQFENVPAGLRVIGEPGCGKSTLLRYFEDSLPGAGLLEHGGGALRVVLEGRTSMFQLLDLLLATLNYPVSGVRASNLHRRRMAFWELVRRNKIRVVLIDEAHQLLYRAGGGSKAPGEGNDATALLRTFTDNRLGLVMAGGLELARLEEFDKYLYSRCQARHSMKSIELKGGWGGVMKKVIEFSDEHSLQLFENEWQREKLHRATGGVLRALKILLTEAVLVSCDAQRNAVTVEDMDLAFSRVMDELKGQNPWVRT